MRIKGISWISRAADEAEVDVTDGNFVCAAFSQPCVVRVGEELKEPLHVSGLKNAMLGGYTEVGFWRPNANGLAYKVVAEMIDARSGLVRVGGIHLLN